MSPQALINGESMSVPEQKPIVVYKANGTTTNFPITFDLHDTEQLFVVVNNEVPEVGAYTVLNKEVVFAVAPENGDEITVSRMTALERETDYKSFNNSFRPQSLNWDFNKIWHVLQESNLIDAKILSRLKEEIEWRRTHDFNYDLLSALRDKQVFEGLKGYTDTLFASSAGANIFGGVTAGVVFAHDKKSLQTHLDETLAQLIEHKNDIRLKANIVDVYTRGQVDSAFAAMAAGHKAYATLADAQSAQSTFTPNTIIEVTNDSTVANNGAYLWNGSTLRKSTYDSLTQAKNYAETFLNRGNVDGIAIKSLTAIGFYHVSNATDFPENFGRTVGVVQVRKSGSHTITELIDRYNPTRVFTCVNFGDWFNDLDNKGNFIAGEILKVTAEGNYYAVDCTDFPKNFGRTVGVVQVKMHGSNRVTSLQDRYDLSKIYYSMNGGPWSSSVSAASVLKNGGNLESVEVKKITEMGTWFVSKALDFPLDYSKDFGFIRVERFGSHALRELIDRDNPSIRFVQVNTSEWSRLEFGGSSGGSGGGATIDIDPSQLPTSELLTNTSDENDVFYNSGGVLKVRQKAFDTDYTRTNASYAVAQRLSTIYGFYDQLVTDFPRWVLRNQIGTDQTGLPIYEYVIQPYGIGKMGSSPASINNFKDVLIRTGEHGQEMTAITSVMLFFKEMMRNERSDQLFGLLRASFRFRIVPCSNPWGVSNANRRNSNGVDLNRNYDYDWINSDGDKGAAPNSELETQAHIAWVNQHKANTLVQINVHDHSDAAITWGCADRAWTQNMLFTSFQKFGAWYRQGFTDPTPEVDLTWLGQPRAGYSDGYVGNVLNVPTILFECPYLDHPKFNGKGSMLNVRKTSIQILKVIMQSLLDRYYLIT